MIRYKGYMINYIPKPNTDRQHDYEFVHEDFEGDSNKFDLRCGSAATLTAAQSAIDSIEAALDEAALELAQEGGQFGAGA